MPAITRTSQSSDRRSPGPVRVLLTGPGASDHSGGIRSVVVAIEDAFRADSRVAITFFATTYGFYDTESWVAKVTRNLAQVPAFWRRLRTCDVVHLNSTFDDRSVIRDLSYLLLATLRGRRVILQFHGGMPERVRLFRYALTRGTCGRLLASAHKVLVLTGQQHESLSRLLPSLGNVRQISNFIDTTAAPAERPRDPGQPCRFLFLARLHRDKGLHDVLKAVERLHSQGCPFALTVCGDGPERQWLVARLKHSPARECITYLGAVSGARKAEVLGACDVLLLPSRHEAFPISILEGFAAGLPVIATPVGAIPEILSTPEAGTLVPVGDLEALVRAMKEFAVAERDLQPMSEHVRQLAQERYSVAVMRRTLSELYGASTSADLSAPESEVTSS